MKKLIALRGIPFSTPLCCDGSAPTWDTDDSRVVYSDTAWEGRPGLAIAAPQSSFNFTLTKTTCGVEEYIPIEVEVIGATETFSDEFPGGRIDPAVYDLAEYWNVWDVGNGPEPHNDNLINYHVPEIQRYTHAPSASNPDHPNDYGQFSGPSYSGGSLVAGATPLGYSPFSPAGATGVVNTAIPASAAQQGLMSDATTWLSGIIVQKEAHAQFGGYFEQTVTLRALLGSFPGGWLNEFFLPLEIDIFEAFRFLCEIHLNIHERPTVIGEYSINSDNLPGLGWAGICPCLDIEVPHKFAGLIRLSDETDSFGCRRWEAVLLVDGKVFASKTLADPVGALHHVSNMAVSGGASFIPGPPTDSQLSYTLHSIKTYQLDSLLGLGAKAITRGTLANTTAGRGNANTRTLLANIGDTISYTPGTAPAGWSMISSVLRTGGVATAQASPTFTLLAESEKQTSYIQEVWRQASSGICVTVPSFGVYTNEE